MLAEPVGEFGVILILNRLHVSVLNVFKKAYTCVVAYLFFCQLGDHKLFSNSETES